VEWDTDDVVKISALNALDRYPDPPVEEVKKAILEAFMSDWEVVREAAGVAAQRCSGLPEADLITGREASSISGLPERAREWLGSFGSER
jgi:hypothetical protein